MVTIGLHPIVVFNTKGFPENINGDPQLEVQLTDATVQPPKTCDVLFSVIVLLPFNPHTTLEIKSGNKGISVLEIIVNVQPLQVILAVTP